MQRTRIARAVCWFHRVRGPAPSWIGAFLLVGLGAAAGPGEAATLNAGDILTAGATIIHVNPATGAQTTVTSGNLLVNPVGIAISARNDVFVVDSNCCDGGTGGVIRVNPITGHQTVVSPPPGGNFPNNFVTPQGIAIAADGDLFVVDQGCCDGGHGGVIRVNPTTGHQTVVSPPPGGNFPNNFVTPQGIAIAANNDVFVVDRFCCERGTGGVIRVNPITGHQTVVSPPPGGNFANNFFGIPQGIAIAGNGDLFVVDRGCCGPHGGVIRVNPVDGRQTVVASSSPGSPFVSPRGIAIALNQDVLVADTECCIFDGGVIRVNPAKPADDNQTVVSPRPGQLSKFDGPRGIAVVGAIVPPGSPPLGSCGGSVPCSCGDRVVRDRTLRGVDPVTRTACPADGLAVATGVTLDLGGATLRGQGAGAGVRIEPGATAVTVRRGAITGFATGVRGEDTTAVHLANVQVLDSVLDGVVLTGDGHAVEIAVIRGSGGHGIAVVGHGARLSRLQVTNSGRTGVRLLGNGHALERSTSENNGGRGAEVSGDGNHVALLQLEGNGDDGVFATGTGNRAARNVAARNAGAGLEIRGEGAAVEANRATSNGAAGLEIRGTSHTLSANYASQNAGTGLTMVRTTGSRLDRNRGENNSGFGFSDDSTGTGTGGTANTYTLNICGRGNGAGPSTPAGLCR